MLEMTRRIYRLLPCVPLPGSLLWWPLMRGSRILLWILRRTLIRHLLPRALIQSVRFPRRVVPWGLLSPRGDELRGIRLRFSMRCRHFLWLLRNGVLLLS